MQSTMKFNPIFSWIFLTRLNLFYWKVYHRKGLYIINWFIIITFLLLSRNIGQGCYFYNTCPKNICRFLWNYIWLIFCFILTFCKVVEKKDKMTECRMNVFFLWYYLFIYHICRVTWTGSICSFVNNGNQLKKNHHWKLMNISRKVVVIFL
jgi:hypothetical protein